MKKKKALTRLIFQEILTSKARFISILLLILIGVSFFSGLNASGPDMLQTAKLYFENQKLMDIHIVSTMGLEEEDIEIIKQQEGIDTLEVGYSKDVITQKQDRLLRIFSYDAGNTLNQFEVIDGKLPSKSGEIALLYSDMMTSIYQIGDIVTFKPDSEDTDLSEQFHKTDYKVVGFVKSPLYISDKQLGSGTVGKGLLDGFGVISNKDFNLPVYTDAYLTLKSLRGLDSYSSQYKDIINEYEKQIESSFETRAITRLADIKEEAKETLEDAKKKVEEGKQELLDGEKKLTDAKEKIEDGKVKLADGEKTLADAKQKLLDGEKEYEDNKALFDEQIADGKTQLDIGGNQLASGQSEINENRKKVEEGRKQIAKGLKEIEAKEAELTTQKVQLLAFLDQTKQVIQVPASFIPTDQQNALIAAGDSISLGNDQTVGDLWRAYFAGQIGGETVVSALEGILSQIEEGIKTIATTKSELEIKQAELTSAKEQLDKAQEQINNGNDTIIEKTREFEAAKADGEAKLAEAKQKIEDGWKEYEEGVTKLEEEKQKLLDAEKEYEDGLAEYQEKKPDALQKIADAEKEIADGEKELNDLKAPTYYALSRSDNPGYDEYADNAKRLSALSLVFPAFFFAIAALVSLTTITRMIEEQRVQIGTLKAQGYTNFEISLKYYVYALGASSIGAILGLLGGFYVIPQIIVSAYRSMYDLPDKQFHSYLWIALVAVGISVLSTGISVWVVLRQELTGTPATLMRPKAPKVGKRIFLERITPIWNRLNFVQKVTMRNLFRYKQRMIMTIFGIAGCMGLMITGFGIGDSISLMSKLQYKDIVKYQAMVIFDEDASSEKKEEAKDVIAKLEGIEDSILIANQLYKVKKTGVNTQQVMVIAPYDTALFSSYVTLQKRGSTDVFEIPKEGAVITEKLSDLFQVKVGDILTLTDSDNQTFEVPVAKITENYAGHFIYLSPKTYADCLGEGEITFNGALLRYNQSPEWEEQLANRLNQYKGILAISYNTSMIGTFDATMDSLNTVVLVIVIAAAVLAFVVLYNLTNINVSERIRELSTIKVLGFYDGEVTMYIYRENIILSLFGIFFGSFLGKLLHYFVLSTASLDNMMFSYVLKTSSYIYAGILTILFSSLVMWVMHNKLKHVDMIEALKSNE